MAERKNVPSGADRSEPSRPSDGASRLPDAVSYPGQRLGMPQAGPGSIARFGRRLLALIVDWVLCQAVAAGLLGYRPGAGGWGPLKPTAVFAVMNILLVGTIGHTIGHRLLGLRVQRSGGGYAGPLAGLVRSVLLAAVLPAMFWDRDQRGMHDKAAGTVIVRS